ncbi:MAG: hypothetical protein M1812_001520 [Candelaria pacifica]|nr:MAG: hypothetical protein M1812_001520 [Candelaria pacifica]
MSPKKSNPPIFQMRTFRLDTTTAPLPPVHHINELLSPAMNLENGHIHHLPTTDRQSSNPMSPVHEYHSPTWQPFSDSLTSSPPTPATSNAGDSHTDTPIADVLPQQWSSAVGRATIGKSGRVIERLMAEVDRYKREIKLETLRREEAQRREDLANGSMESLKSTNELLLEKQEADRATLARKERKISELKEDLATEVTRREKAERQVVEVSKERNESVNRATQIALEEKDRSLKATSQYDILASSWKQLDDGYKKATKILKADLNQVTVARQEDARVVEKLGVVVSQLRQELEKCKKGKDAMEKLFEDYRKAAEDGTQAMRDKAETNEAENARLLSEMTRVMGQMRYTINVSQNMRDLNQAVG